MSEAITLNLDDTTIIDGKRFRIQNSQDILNFLGEGVRESYLNALNFVRESINNFLTCGGILISDGTLLLNTQMNSPLTTNHHSFNEGWINSFSKFGAASMTLKKLKHLNLVLPTDLNDGFSSGGRQCILCVMEYSLHEFLAISDTSHDGLTIEFLSSEPESRVFGSDRAKTLVTSMKAFVKKQFPELKVVQTNNGITQDKTTLFFEHLAKRIIDEQFVHIKGFPMDIEM